MKKLTARKPRAPTITADDTRARSRGGPFKIHLDGVAVTTTLRELAMALVSEAKKQGVLEAAWSFRDVGSVMITVREKKVRGKKKPRASASDEPIGFVVHSELDRGSR